MFSIFGIVNKAKMIMTEQVSSQLDEASFRYMPRSALVESGESRASPVFLRNNYTDFYPECTSFMKYYLLMTKKNKNVTKKIYGLILCILNNVNSRSGRLVAMDRPHTLCPPLWEDNLCTTTGRICQKTR